MEAKHSQEEAVPCLGEIMSNARQVSIRPHSKPQVTNKFSIETVIGLSPESPNNQHRVKRCKMLIVFLNKMKLE